jgi:ferredoxin
MDPGFLIICIFGGILLLLFLPFKGAHRFSYQAPSKRIDEADAVLSRRLLEPGSASYEKYYREHPDLKEIDDLSRSAPGLLSARSRYYHPATFAAAVSNFHLIESLGPLTYEQPKETMNTMLHAWTPADKGKKKKTDPEKISNFIIHWMKQNGAHSTGITPLRSYHLYSHKGRGARSGQPIDLIHTSAIAITVEMDQRMMASAPAGTSVMESSEQYLRSGLLALKLATFIRELGYQATAHIDGHYEVICPLVAADAGLGTIGRMGLLMTPRLGPRVRIAAVTTDLNLIPARKTPDRTTIHFCHLCKKCALNCPAAAIPDGPQTQQEEVPRWRINSEKCYHFWTLSGTDCGRCIMVCPFSHRNNFLHGFVRWGIKNNLVFRYLALKLDHVFYGRRPRIRPLPQWAEIMDKP